jgi:hypothetical protein
VALLHTGSRRAVSCSLILQPAELQQKRRRQQQQQHGNVTNSLSGLSAIPPQSVLDHVGVSATSSFTAIPLRLSKHHLPPPRPPLLQKKFFGSGNWNFIYHLMPFFYMRMRFLIIRGNILFV